MISQYLSNAMLAAQYNGTVYTFPSTLAIAVTTSAPSFTSTGATIVEPPSSGSAYARQLLNPSTSNWTVPSGGTLQNNATVTFPTATSSWGTIIYVCLLDSGTYGSGNLLEYGAMSASQAINTGGTLSFPVGSITPSIS